MFVSKSSLAYALLFVSAALAPLSACKSEKADEATTADSAEPVAATSGAEPHRKRELPPAAFEACQAKALGDTCTVSFGEKQIESKCAASPDGRLACHPNHAGHKKPD